ncbi:membrane protein (plasmid) [Fulvitalea axinellae]|uniref:Membrane protein n=1 Tax=Fulvitalea axinellae TaxID=1182444 RepID=A0AAU9CJE5_9BACT|nr:membrane protein [Fulvitalea axinellae]
MIGNKFKKYILALIAMSGIAFSSCEDLLEQTSPDTLTTDNYWRTPDDVRRFAVAVYDQLSYFTWKFGEVEFVCENLRGDDLVAAPGATQYGYLGRVVNFTNNDEWSPRNIWYKNYNMIHLSNQALANMGRVSGLSDADKAKFEAEFRFLKAYAHFDIWKNFHGVIIRDEVVSNGEQIDKALATEAEIDEYFVREFTAAANGLPAKWDDNNYGRATSGAAWAYLGKFHLYRKQWAEATAAFAKVTGYGLEDNFRSLFNGTNEQNKESIFVSKFSIDANTSQHSNLGLALVPGEKNGWNLVRVSEFATNSYEANDIRKDASVLLDGGTLEGETVDFDDENMRMLAKYVESMDIVNTGKSGTDYILMRYADVLLMNAEALNEQNQTGPALAALNQVRSRAGLGNFSGAQAEIRTEIKKQRMLELLGEGHRFYDLVRWGNPKQALSVEGGHPGAVNFEEGKHNYFPIPAVEYDENNLVDPTPKF